MQLNQLRSLVAIADVGSISGAARELRVSQPAVTRALRQLEIDVKATLVCRSSSGAVLTGYGKALVSHARLILKAAEKADQHISQMVEARGGTLSIASSATPFIILLPRALAMVRQQFPGLSVRLQEVVYPTVLELFRDGSIDFAIGPEPAEGLGENFSCRALLDVELVVVLRRGHPLSKLKSLEGLANLNWILAGPKDGPGAVHDRAFRDAGIKPPQFLTNCESVSAAVYFVAHSDAASFVPRPIATSFEESGLVTVVEVADSAPVVRVSLMHPTNSILTPAGQAFYSAISSVGRTSARAV
jgi:LysR family transcriptional regulator of abg operon